MWRFQVRSGVGWPGIINHDTYHNAPPHMADTALDWKSWLLSSLHCVTIWNIQGRAMDIMLLLDHGVCVCVCSCSCSCWLIKSDVHWFIYSVSCPLVLSGMRFGTTMPVCWKITMQLWRSSSLTKRTVRFSKIFRTGEQWYDLFVIHHPLSSSPFLLFDTR